MTHRLLSTIAAVLLLAGAACARQVPPTTVGDLAPEPLLGPADRHGATTGVEDPQLAAILLDHWESLMREWPTWATRQGDHRFDHLLAGTSPSDEARRDAFRGELIARAEALDEAALNAEDTLTRRLFLGELRAHEARDVCRFEDWSLSVRGNPVAEANDLADLHPRDDAEDFENLRVRYVQLERLLEESRANLQRGLEDGLVANLESVRRVIELTDTWLQTPLASNVLLSPLDELPPDLSEQERGRITAEIRNVVEMEVIPAVRVYHRFLGDEVAPAARASDASGLSHLPVGEACYAALVQRYTTLPLSPDTLHATGLAELESIHAEFRVLGQRLWGTDDLAAIIQRLRTDPDLYFTSEEEVRAKAESALQTARETMPNAFGRLPQAACEVDAIPDLQAPYTTIAYYRRPAPDGSRPGVYYVNTYAPQTRPRHEAEVLAFHESIPGHHLQIAIAQELGALPAFRRNLGATAFVEGWALYTERLSDELGMYSGDLDRLGMLSFDSWRAARLVVDTGIHDQGRSREWAVQFLLDNTPLAPNNIDNEVDRYITTPGQALAYKTGQLEILALRRQAEGELGDGFDLSAFHDVVLGGGAVTLPVLRERIEAWLARSAATSGESEAEE